MGQKDEVAAPTNTGLEGGAAKLREAFPDSRVDNPTTGAVNSVCKSDQIANPIRSHPTDSNSKSQVMGRINIEGGTRQMKIALGADHAGFELKEKVKALLAELRHDVLDVGTCSTESVDYPDFAEAVGMAVRDGKSERGILICGSGVGASVAANKIPGVRAGLCHDHYSAHQGVEHDDINVLVLGGRVIGEAVALELVQAFLAAQYSHETRHERRLQKVKAIERRHAGKDAKLPTTKANAGR